MPKPKSNDVQRTLAVRVSPDYHAQLAMVAQIDEISLTDLMMAALDAYVASRREAPDFQAKAQKALEDAEAQMARTRAMLLGTLSEAGTTTEAAAGTSASGRARRKGRGFWLRAGSYITEGVEGGPAALHSTLQILKYQKASR